MSTNIANVTGPQLVAVMVSWGVFGVLTSQVYTYSEAFTKDRTVTKCLVYAIYVIQAIQLLLLTNAAFKILASGFGDILGLITQVDILWLPVFVLEGIVTCAVQSYYAWRITNMSGSRIPMTLILLLSLTSFIFSILIAVRIKAADNLAVIYSNSDGHNFSILVAWTIISTVCDVMIAGCMTYSYLRNRMPVGPEQFNRITNVANGFVRSAVATGSFVACTSIINLGLVVTAKRSHLYYVCPIGILSGLHATTLLGLLNGRIRKYVLFKSHSTDWSAGNMDRNAFATLDGMGDRNEDQGREVSDRDLPGPSMTAIR